MRKRKQKRLIWGTIIVVFLLVAGFFSFHGLGSKQSSKTITVGIMTPTKADEKIWNQVKKTAKDKYGITVKYKTFTDYNQPNKALANGSIDLNAFQHYAFLKNWNKANNGSLVAIGKTFITPTHLYSSKYSSLKDLPDGATIAVPNDASNESRALFILKNAGLITLKKKAGTLATVADIKSNPHNLKIKELSAEQTARSLDDVDAAVVNTNYAQAAKLPDKEILYTEPVNKDSEQWINIIVANKKDRNNEAYKDFVKSYQTTQVKNLIKKAYGNNELAAWDLKLK